MPYVPREPRARASKKLILAAIFLSVFVVVAVITFCVNRFIIKENLLISRGSYKIKLIKKVINYIHLNYYKKIYIEDLAKEINMNREYFCRFFKSIMGRTPVEYINYYRIEQAAKLLSTRDEKILDISLQVGFENFSYFIKKFKEYKKCTPSRFK
jgi:AraC-like DNA-binding protein